MRSLLNLLDFLENTMSMAAVYQPVVILHLLTRDGVAHRSELARTLSGYEGAALEDWDKTLMDNPKQVLVGTHEILTYDKDRQQFALNLALDDRSLVEKAIALCEAKILEWIQKEQARGKLDEAEMLRLYQVLEVARRGETYWVSSANPLVEEFALRVAIQELHRAYRDQPIKQQPYDTLGFNILVGTVDAPVVFVNVKGTERLRPSVGLSEGERRFSMEQGDRFVLMVVYAINRTAETYQFTTHQEAIGPDGAMLTPSQWRLTLLKE